jgi:hypothetical protein
MIARIQSLTDFFHNAYFPNPPAFSRLATRTSP